MLPKLPAILALAVIAAAVPSVAAERLTGCLYAGGDCVVDDYWYDGPIIVCIREGPGCNTGLPERPCAVGADCVGECRNLRCLLP